MPNFTDDVPASFPTHFAGLVAAHPNEPQTMIAERQVTA